MGTWDIEPKEGVTINTPDDGNYIFTPPPSEIGQRTYTITYTDDNGVTGKTIYVVRSTDCYADPCQNDFNGPNVTFLDGSKEKTVESTAGNVSVQYDLGTCWIFVKAEKDGVPNNITSFRDSDGKVIYYAANDSVNEFPSSAKYTFVNDSANITTYSYVKIKQQSKCASENPPTISPTAIVDVPIEGKTGNRIDFVETPCWVLESATPRDNWVTVSNVGHNVDVSRNDTASARETVIDYVFKNTEDSTKTTAYTVNVNQLFDACIGDRDCPQLSNPTTTVHVSKDGTGNQPVQVTYDLSSCWTLKSKSLNVGTDVASFTSDDGKGIKIEKNTGNESRSITATYIFENTTISKVCDNPPQYVNIEQDPGCTCSCDAVTFDIGRDNHLFDMDAATVVLDGAVLTINDSSCNINDFSIVPYPSSGLSDYVFTSNGNNTYGLTLELPSVSEPEVLILKLTHQGSHDCNKSMMIYRRCYCGSDNCRNVYRNPISGDLGDIIEDNPLYLKSYYTDGVSVPNTYDTFAINKGEMYEDEACTKPITTGWSKTNGWCTAEYFDNGNCFMIHYVAEENHTSSERSITFTYYTKENTIMNNCVPGYEGKHACRKFTVTIFQAADGYEYCDCNTMHPYGIDPETGRHYRMQCLFADAEKYEDEQGQHSKCNCVNNCKQCTDL